MVFKKSAANYGRGYRLVFSVPQAFYLLAVVQLHIVIECLEFLMSLSTGVSYLLRGISPLINANGLESIVLNILVDNIIDVLVRIL